MEPRIQHDRTDAELHALRFEPTLRIQMFGLPYVNEERRHGVRKGEQAARGVSWALDDLDPLTNPQAPTGLAGVAEGAGAG